ncbi:response regulator transcription factor [Shewanella sp. GXUN23E]|uniref:response regulator transcription factor n=1 Tax=Shewanella sp. GXUN23E TaxID=3422498 RepID=UPI003D7DCE63
MSKQTVWVVDDDRDYCQLIAEVLEDDFEVKTFHAARDYELALEDAHPEVVLMDINLPDKDGITLCKELVANGTDSSVLFVSGMNTLDERLRAYDAGGVDFIAKPFELKELIAKTNAVAAYQSRKKMLMQSESMSRNMAFQSMTESSQYGSVMQFFRQCFLCQSYDDLAQAFFDVMQQLNLKTCLEIRVGEPKYYVPENSAISPIEANIFELLDKQGRLFDFGSRTICNDKHVSFLIKNMPLDDEVLYGRLRDVIAVIIEGLEARVLDIQRQQTLQMVLDKIQSLLSGVKQSIMENDKRFSKALTNITTDIRSSFHVLDMTLEQEDYFSTLVERHLKEANSAGDAFVRLQRSLNSVISEIEAKQ